MRWLASIAIVLGGCSVISGTEDGIPDPGPGGDMDAAHGGTDSGISFMDSGTPPAMDAGRPTDPDAGPPRLDAGPPRADAGPPPVDSGPVRPVRAVQCGEARCMGVEACCVTPDERHCIDSAMSECRCEAWFCETTVIACDGPSDCPATQVCCAARGITEDHADRVQCAERCADDAITRRVEVCQDGDGLSCRDGGDCGSVTWLPSGLRGCM